MYKTFSIKSWPKKRIWKYRTTSFNIHNYLLWIVFRPLMLWKADGKISHWWHWEKREMPVSIKGTTVSGDKTIKKRENILDDIQISLGGYKKLFIVQPKNGQVKEWIFAFQSFKNKKIIEYCSIILEGPVQILQAHESGKIFGFDKSNKEIQLKVNGPFHRSMKNKYPII